MNSEICHIMVVFECERVKVPNTGIYYFCRNLAHALIAEMSGEKEFELGFFLRRRNKGIFGPDVRYLLYKSIYKYIFPYWLMKGGVWHTTFQYPQIMPSRGNVVLTVHDLNFLYENTPEQGKRLLSLLQRNVDRASVIVAISEYVKQDIMRHLDLKGKEIKVIYNGCEEYAGELKEPDEKPEGEFILTLGATMGKKNVHVLPCLLKDNDLHLVIVGEKVSPYADKILGDAVQWGVTDRVHFTGAVGEDLKHWYLAHCRAFVFPSIAEGFGLPVLEAMYYGKPVFLSCFTSLPEIGKDKAFYFNKDFDRKLMQKEFAEGLRRFDAGEITPEQIKEHARSFSWKIAAKKYLNLYKSMI